MPILCFDLIIIAICSVSGDFPSSLHFNVQTVPYSKFATFSDEELEQWLQMLWKEKEDSLKKFHQINSFPAGPVFKDNWIISLKLWGYLAYALFSFIVFFYYLPWTLLAMIFFGMVSYYIHTIQGGWNRVILNMDKKK